MAEISGTIITYNEEDHIEACIASLMQVCSEVVVVDSLSTDRTVELAEQAGARVIHQEYLGEGEQRGITEKHARHDWILALDADERIDDEMMRSIRGLELDDPDVAYCFNRKSFVGKRWIRGPGFYPDVLARLYNRTRAGYVRRWSHASVQAPRELTMPGHIIHYTYDDMADWIGRINQVTSIDAKGLFKAGRGPSRSRPVVSAISSFVREYFTRGGIWKGEDGRTIAFLSMLVSFLKYEKLNELHFRARDEQQK